MLYPTWGYSPPTRGLSNPYYKVHGPRSHQEVPGWILGHFPWSGMIHYEIKSKKNFPCPGETCPVCGPSFGSRKKGYLAGVSLDYRQPFVFELTSGALDQLAPHWETRQTLRGLKLTLSRSKKKDGSPSKQGKVIVKIADERPTSLLPPAFDVVPHVARSWGLDPESIADLIAQLPPVESRLDNPHDLVKLREQLGGIPS